MTAQDKVRRFFRDHDGWRVGVASNEAGHDCRVDDAQTVDAVNSKLRVDHMVWPAPHRTGANRVECSAAVVADEVD